MLSKYVGWYPPERPLLEIRSKRIIMTNEARVLKELRVHHKLSMKKAATLIGRSDSYIAHIETGRMDPPKGNKLERLLAIYGGIKQKSFYEKVRVFRERTTPRDELLELVIRMPQASIDAILAVARTLNR